MIPPQTLRVLLYVLFFIRLGTREVHVAGVTPHPNQAWMMQVARNITMEEWGFLAPGQYLIHDRDGKYHIPPHYVVERFSCSLKAARGEDLQVEHPVRCGDAPAFHFH